MGVSAAFEFKAGRFGQRDGSGTFDVVPLLESRAHDAVLSPAGWHR
jgi:hypothetical protein